MHLLPSLLVALASCWALPGNAETWEITRKSVKVLPVPEAILEHPTIAEFEHPSGATELPVVLRDLNGDGAAEYFVQSAPSLCGNGGCPYAIFDGQALSYVGQVFGNIVRERREQFRGWTVLECFSHLSASATGYGLFAHSGVTYALVASLELPSSTAQRLLEPRTSAGRPRRDGT